MNTHIADAEKCLQDNNRIGMSSADEPIHWNLHNATAALLKAFEEERRKSAELERRVKLLEQQIRALSAR